MYRINRMYKYKLVLVPRGMVAWHACVLIQVLQILVEYTRTCYTVYLRISKWYYTRVGILVALVYTTFITVSALVVSCTLGHARRCTGGED